MKKIAFAVLILSLALLAGCDSYEFGETGQYIVTAKQALTMAGEGAVLVDARSAQDYDGSHVEGAVSVPMSDLAVNEPFETMLPEAAQIEQVMGRAGLSADDTLLVYDNADNKQAARVLWTLNMYGNFNVRVVSGGLTALEEAGAAMSSQAVSLAETDYTAGDKEKTLLVNMDYVQMLLNKPQEDTVLIDTRSSEEYAAGTIPGAVNIEFLWNDYASGQYKSPRDLQSTYIGKGILPDMKLILFCRTSVRAAQTYTALKDAGYTDVRVYDGSWVEYSASGGVTQDTTQAASPSGQDAS